MLLQSGTVETSPVLAALVSISFRLPVLALLSADFTLSFICPSTFSFSVMPIDGV